MESEVKNGMITQPLISSWKESLAIVGHAVCVHPQCRLCFLSIQGMISHHKSCIGWTSQGDYIPCTHCGARFKQFRSIQTHVERCHNNQFSASTSQSSGSWASPPPLPLTPDIVPRAPAPAPSSTPSASQEQEQELDHDSQQTGGAWTRRLSCNTNQSSISVREDVLAEKEVRLSELESLVRQTEIKAEQVRKEAELSQWERDLEAREMEYRRRLEEATKILNESRAGTGTSSAFLPSPSFLSCESVRSSSTSVVSPEASEGPSHHSTPSQRQTLHVLSPRQIFGPPRRPIVLPSSAKLPPSAIMLTPTTLPLFQNGVTSSSSISQTSSEDSPINLSRSRRDERSIDEETTISQPSISSLPGDVPCVEVSQATAFELPVKVVEDSVSSIQVGDSVNISYPVTDSNCQILLQDDVILQDYLHTSGAEVVTFVAEDGPNGQITLVPQEDFREITTEKISEEFDELKRNMAEINVREGEESDETTATRVENSQVINYFEGRLRDFECEINQNDSLPVPDCQQIQNLEHKEENFQNKPASSKSTSSVGAIKKRKLKDFEEDVSQKDSLSISRRRRSSRLNSCSDPVDEPIDIVVTNYTQVKDISLPKRDEPSTFSCGRCNSVLQSERSWNRHRDSVHGGCARLQAHPDGQHFNVEQEEEAWRAALTSCKKISCPRCNKVNFTKANTLLDHLTKCGKVEASKVVKPSPETTKKDAELSTPPGRSRRKAATKAMSTVAEFVKAMKTKYDGDSSEEEQEVEANVEDSDDNFNIGSEVNVSNFYKQIKVGKRINYLCNVCNSNYKKKEDVENHILSEHKDKLSEGEDDYIEDSDEGSSGTDVVEDEDEDIILESDTERTNKRKNEHSRSNQRRLIIEPNVEAIRMERKFRHLYYGKIQLSDMGFDESPQKSWKKVNSTQFTSKGENSPSFLIRSMFGSSYNAETKKIKQFSGDFSNNQWMLYTGGPVVCMSWCTEDTEGSQLLALVSKLNFTPSPLLKSYYGPGLIQFWSVPARGAPVFEFGLSHQHGDVTCLEWCPSQPLSVRGLVAGSSSDGTVRVWAVPHLERGEGQLYSSSPQLTLRWGEEEAGQCLSVSWYRGPGHHYLAATSSQGLASVWHLAARSPLLRQGSDLLPVQTWLAHSGSASSVSLSPGSDEVPRYAVTGGSDRCYKFWDLRDTSVPIQEVKRGLVSGVEWVPSWCGAAVSFDDVYLQGHTQTMLAEAGYYSNKSHPVISQNSAVTSLGVSHWLGCMAVTTTSGELILFVMPSLERSLEHDKNLAQRRTYVYRTEVTASKSLSDVEARKFEAVKEVQSLRFIDSCLGKSSKQPVCPPEELRRVRLATDSEDLTHFPLAGLNALAWNNNLGHQNILASGGQAGLVRIHRLEGLHTPSVQTALQETV